MREERKVVTAVFADLVGSTALGEALDPEEVKLIVSEAVARIVHAVEAFGGTVKDLAGDGVLALFGAPVSHEDDAERGVRAAVRITQDVAARVLEAVGSRLVGVRQVLRQLRRPERRHRAAPRLTRLRATQATPRPVTSARSVSPKMKKAAVANTL